MIDVQAAPLTRQEQERAFHDRLRAADQDDARLVTNRKFYAIGRSNHAFGLERLARACRGKRVLDFCCGDGETGLLAATLGAASVVGVDISPVSVEDANRRAHARGLGDRARFEVMDAEAMTFPDASFDVAIVGGVLHHLDLNAAYRGLARVLSDDGVALCGEALRHNPIFQAYRRLTPHLRTAWETDHILGRGQILAAKKYFHEVRVDRFFHLATVAAVPFRNTRAFGPVLTALEQLDLALLSLPGVRWMAWQCLFTLARPARKVRS